MADSNSSAFKGRIATQVLGANAVEIKATIAQPQIAKAMSYLGIAEASGEKRVIMFFDTPGLNLFKSGLILRARRKIGQQHDSTIKFRPVAPEDVSSNWHKNPGFKFEADATEKTFVRSASLTRDVSKGLIKSVAAGDAPVKALFDKQQERFMAELSGGIYKAADASVLGPLDALFWQIKHPGLPWPFVAELWVRPDGAKILEASVRVPIAQTAAAGAGFLAFLAEIGVAKDATQVAKTRWALDYFSKRVATPKLRAAGKPTDKKRTASKPVKRGKAAAIRLFI